MVDRKGEKENNTSFSKGIPVHFEFRAASHLTHGNEDDDEDLVDGCLVVLVASQQETMEWVGMMIKMGNWRTY